MSATPNNGGAGLSGPPPKTTLSGPPPNGEGGQNALQALLAFACIHEQAERRRHQHSAPIPDQSSEDSKEEQFALDEVLQLVSERALSITGADGVAIALAEKNAIVCRASVGRISPDPGIKLDPNSGFSGTCLRSGQTVRCDDSETDSRVNAQVCRTLGTRSMVAVPLAAKQHIIGLVEAFSTEAYGFNDSDVRSLNLLGELILAAIRPEEENRLAEIAARVLVPEPAKLTESKPPAAPVVAHPSSRIIVDEKFAPLPSRTEAPKVEVSPPTHTEPLTPEAPLEVSASVPNISTAAPAIAPKEAEHAKEETKAATIAVSMLARLRATAIVQHVRSLPWFSRIGLAALVLVAIVLGWAVWLKIRHDEQAISANTQKSIQVKTAKGDLREIILPAPAEVKPGPSPQVTGLHHISSGDTSSVVVDLQDQVQYEERSLDNPARVYVDIHDTKIAPGLANEVIEVDDSLLKRVRMAQPVEGVTRVVLELKDNAVFSGVKLESNPYRLTIDVHNGAVVTASKTTPAIAPRPSPSIVSTNKPANKQPGAGAKEFEVALDAGHGGWDLGTVGKKGLLEKDVVLDIVGRLGKLLENNLGAQVIYTRQDDSYLSLEKRAEIANVAGANLFLSVHANYSDLSTARGVETYYTNTYSSIKARSNDDDPALKKVNWTNVDIRTKVTDSHRFAADVQQALCTRLVAINPDLRNRGVKEAQYVVLTGTQMPAVLAEVSFVSSPEDEHHLQSSEYRQLIAEALYKGVAKYREDSKSKSTKLASAKQ